MDTILDNDSESITILVKNYVQSSFSKKIGKKKINKLVKDSIKLCHSKSVQYYFKFLKCSNKFPANLHNQLKNNQFLNFFPTPSNNNAQNFSFSSIDATTISDLDSKITTLFHYNSVPSTDE